jgi:hypothetical protein
MLSATTLIDSRNWLFIWLSYSQLSFGLLFVPGDPLFGPRLIGARWSRLQQNPVIGCRSTLQA